MLTRRRRREQLSEIQLAEASPSTTFRFLNLPTEIQSLIITYLHIWSSTHGIDSSACVTTLMPSYCGDERYDIWNCYGLNREFNNLTREIVWKIVNLMHLPDTLIKWFAHQIRSKQIQTDVILALLWTSKSMKSHERLNQRQEDSDSSQSEEPQSVDKEAARANLFITILENLPNLTFIGIHFWPSPFLHHDCLEASQYRILNSITKFSGQLTILELSGNLDCTFLATFLLHFQSLERLRMTEIVDSTDSNGALSLTLSSFKNLRVIYFADSLFINNTFLTRTWSSKLRTITFESWDYSGILDLNLNSFILQFKETLQTLQITRILLPQLKPHAIVPPQFHYSFPKLVKVQWDGHQHLLPNFQGCPLISARLNILSTPGKPLQKFLRKFLDQHILLRDFSITLSWNSRSEYDEMLKIESDLKSYLLRKGRKNVKFYIVA